MNYDITFCSNKNCKNLECKRNQINVSKEECKIRNGIWISDFIDCEYFKKENK